MGTHGVLAEERARAQPFEVDLDLSLDLSAAAGSDDLVDTVDYGAVVEAVAAVVEGPHCDLIERLAGCIADDVLALDPRITTLTVQVTKLRPPVPRDLATASVRLTRTKPA